MSPQPSTSASSYLHLARIPIKLHEHAEKLLAFFQLHGGTLMLRAALSSLLASILVPAFAIQVPSGSGHHRKDEHHAVPGPTQWSFSKGPHPNVTDHLVFETVYSLLQFWPNIRMRNGEI